MAIDADPAAIVKPPLMCLSMRQGERSNLRTLFCRTVRRRWTEGIVEGWSYSMRHSRLTISKRMPNELLRRLAHKKLPMFRANK